MAASPLRLYYYRHRDGKPNFGDQLSPMIIERVLGRPTVWAKQTECDMAAIGSILGGILQRSWKRWVTLRFSPVHIWGSGFIRAPETRELMAKGALKVHAVRGHATRSSLAMPENLALGDPGLLAGRLFDKPPVKRHGWAIVPHTVDARMAVIRGLKAVTPHAVVADLSGDPDECLQAIAGAEFVISTSLHGLIVADALGIPSIWAKMSGRVSGDRYKFRDYYSALGMEAPDRFKIRAPLNLNMLCEKAVCAPAAAVERCADDLVRGLSGDLAAAPQEEAVGLDQLAFRVGRDRRQAVDVKPGRIHEGEDVAVGVARGVDVLERQLDDHRPGALKRFAAALQHLEIVALRIDLDQHVLEAGQRWTGRKGVERRQFDGLLAAEGQALEIVDEVRVGGIDRIENAGRRGVEDGLARRIAQPLLHDGPARFGRRAARQLARQVLGRLERYHRHAGQRLQAMAREQPLVGADIEHAVEGEVAQQPVQGRIEGKRLAVTQYVVTEQAAEAAREFSHDCPRISAAT
ncbi:MAG: polysaccharide pyruvyl transferase family protein [Asticcacaulis sp.]